MGGVFVSGYLYISSITRVGKRGESRHFRNTTVVFKLLIWLQVLWSYFPSLHYLKLQLKAGIIWNLKHIKPYQVSQVLGMISQVKIYYECILHVVYDLPTIWAPTPLKSPWEAAPLHGYIHGCQESKHQQVWSAPVSSEKPPFRGIEPLPFLPTAFQEVDVQLMCLGSSSQSYCQASPFFTLPPTHPPAGFGCYCIQLSKNRDFPLTSMALLALLKATREVISMLSLQKSHVVGGGLLLLSVQYKIFPCCCQ